MPHDIIDNRDEKLIDHIRQILPGCQAAKFAVGYFFLSGLEAVTDQLDNVQELRQQISVLEAAFRRPGPLPAVRSELNRIKREGLSGEPLLEVLSDVYHVHGLDRTPEREEDAPEENDTLPRIVCSEALV